MRRALLAGAVLAALAACGERGVHVLAPEELPPDIYSPSPSPAASPSPPQARSVHVWLVREGRLVPVRRTTEAPVRLVEFAVRSLLAGPVPEEREAGVTTAIPAAAGLLRVEADGAVVSVDLTREFQLGAEESVQVLRVAQVVYTATELPGITGVLLLIEGNPVEVAGADGTPRRGPVGRGDYPLLPP